MKRSHLVLLLLMLGANTVFAQDTEKQEGQLRPASFGFGVIFNDFTTARNIRNSSIETVLNNKQQAKLGEMAPGIAVTYAKGLRPRVDFAATFGFTSGKVVLRNKPDEVNNAAVVALDASVQLKMLPENFMAIPYVSAGVGATAIQGYYGAMMPLGVGFRFRVSEDFFVNLQSQYRVAVTETAGYHFMHGLTVLAKL